MNLGWKIGSGLIAVLLTICLFQYGKRVWTSIKRLKVAERRIKAEATEVRQLGIETAQLLGEQVLEEKASLESWSGPVPANVNLVLNKLDGSIQSLFRAHRRCCFRKTGTQFNAEFLLSTAATAIEDAYLIGRDELDESIQHKLIVKPGSPILFELNEDDHVVEKYPSVYHYFLLAEKE